MGDIECQYEHTKGETDLNSYKRAFFYVARKKGKSLTIFLLLLLVTVSVMTGISIRNGTEKAAQTLRETIGASFTMSGNIDSLKFDRDVAFHWHIFHRDCHAVFMLFNVLSKVKDLLRISML